MGLIAVAETADLISAKQAALSETDKEFVVQFAFATGDKELINKLIDELVCEGADEALDKVESLAKEPERMKDVEMVEPSLLGAVAEPEFQYGAEAFEAYQQTAKTKKAMVSEVKVPEVKGKSR